MFSPWNNSLSLISIVWQGRNWLDGTPYGLFYLGGTHITKNLLVGLRPLATSRFPLGAVVVTADPRIICNIRLHAVYDHSCHGWAVQVLPTRVDGWHVASIGLSWFSCFLFTVEIWPHLAPLDGEHCKGGNAAHYIREIDPSLYDRQCISASQVGENL